MSEIPILSNESKLLIKILSNLQKVENKSNFISNEGYQLVYLLKSIEEFEKIFKFKQKHTHVVCQFLKYEYYPKYEILIQQGSLIEKFYILIEGTLSISNPVIEKSHSTIPKIGVNKEKNVSNKGFIFGKREFSTLGYKSEVTIVAKTDCHLAVLDLESFTKINQEIKILRFRRKVEFFQNIPFFKELSQRVLERIALKTKLNIYVKGQTIYKIGSDSLLVYIVRKGEFLERIFFDQHQIDSSSSSHTSPLNKRASITDNFNTLKNKSEGLELGYRKEAKIVKHKHIPLNIIIKNYGKGEIFGFEEVILKTKRFTWIQCKSLSAKAYEINASDFLNCISINKDTINRFKMQMKRIKEEYQNKISTNVNFYLQSKSQFQPLFNDKNENNEKNMNLENKINLTRLQRNVSEPIIIPSINRNIDIVKSDLMNSEINSYQMEMNFKNVNYRIEKHYSKNSNLTKKYRTAGSLKKLNIMNENIYNMSSKELLQSDTFRIKNKCIRYYKSSFSDKVNHLSEKLGNSKLSVLYKCFHPEKRMPSYVYSKNDTPVNERGSKLKSQFGITSKIWSPNQFDLKFFKKFKI